MTTVVKSLAKIHLSASHPQIQLPQLPEEIWMVILQTACGIPELGDSPKLLSFTLTPHLKVMRKKLSTQRHIVSVCKLWYRIALPFLYEQIVIFLPSHMHRLSETLASRPSLGDYTKRFDVNFFLDEPNKNTLVDFLSVLLRLSNLRVLIYDSEFYIGSPDIPPLLPEHIARLRELRMMSMTAELASVWVGDSSDSSDISFPSLRTVSPFFFKVLSSQTRPISVAEIKRLLPSLSQLHMRSYPLVDPTNLPSLPMVTSLFLSGSICRLNALHLLSPNLPSVQYVTLRTTLQDFLSGIDEPLIQPIRAICLPNTVHTLGILIEDKRAKTSRYRAVAKMLEAEVRGDGLKVVRFGGLTAEDILSRPTAYAVLDKACKDKGWKLEFGDMSV
ncbi:hypothetical protein D9757_010898 [Collybiopsis confluens]|nr:hypothetical protein D9757_010898 [Collybiopsis confluens]